MSVKLGETLVRKGFIDEGQLSQALERQSEEGGLLGSILVEMGFAHGAQIREVLTRKYGGVFIVLSDVEIDPELAGLISEEIARRYSVVPVARARGSIAVAMVDPTDVTVADELQFLTGYRIEPMMASEAEVLQTIEKFYTSGFVPAEARARVSRAAELVDSAESLILQERYEQAVATQEEAVVVYEDALGRDHVEVAKARSRLGYAYLLQERYEAAELALTEAVELLDASRGGDHIEMASALNNLGVVLDHRGRIREAQSCFERALAIERDALGAQRPETGITVLSLAHTCTRQRRFADAEPLFELAVKLLSTTTGPGHALLTDAKAGLEACRWSQRALNTKGENAKSRATRDR